MNLEDYKNILQNQDLRDITARVGQNISDSDLRRYFGNEIDSSVIKYSELANYNSIESLLTYDKSFKIILFENDYNRGHWILMLRYGKTIEFFNSYGLKPNADFGFISKKKAELLGQNPIYLKKLLDDAIKKRYDVIYNKMRFQQLKNGINTCGRWIIFRIILLKYFNYNLKDFINFVKDLSNKFGMSMDTLVSHFII